MRSQFFAVMVRRFPALEDSRLRWWLIWFLLGAIGNGCLLPVLGWHAWTLSGSPGFLAALAFCQGAPLLLLLPYSARWASLFGLERMALIGRSIQALAGALLWVSAQGGEAGWPLLLCALLLGIGSSVEAPARHALIAQWSPRESAIASAVGLQSLVINISRMLGPLLAAPLMARHLFGWGYACFAALALPAMIFLATHAISQRRRAIPAPWREGGSPWVDFACEARLVLGSPNSARALLLGITIGFFASPYMQLLPAFAERLGGPSAYGWMLATGALGAFCAAIRQSARQLVPEIGTVEAYAFAGFLSLMGFSLSSGGLAYGFMLITSYCLMSATVGTQAWALTSSHESRRAMRAALSALALFGAPPLGAVLISLLAMPLGIGGAVALSAGCALALSVCLSRALRRGAKMERPTQESEGLKTLEIESSLEPMGPQEFEDATRVAMPSGIVPPELGPKI